MSCCSHGPQGFLIGYLVAASVNLESVLWVSLRSGVSIRAGAFASNSHIGWLRVSLE